MRKEREHRRWRESHYKVKSGMMYLNYDDGREGKGERQGVTGTKWWDLNWDERTGRGTEQETDDQVRNLGCWWLERKLHYNRLHPAFIMIPPPPSLLSLFKLTFISSSSSASSSSPRVTTIFVVHKSDPRKKFYPPSPSASLNIIFDHSLPSPFRHVVYRIRME